MHPPEQPASRSRKSGERPSIVLDSHEAESAGSDSPEVVEQALFGYRNGHRLLASSVALDADIERLLTRLSDTTGAATTSSFDGYLSGYPLSDGRYVLSRTWAAIEMPRPGSVWTHALLIPPTVFRALRTPMAVVDELRRPTEDRLKQFTSAIPAGRFLSASGVSPSLSPSAANRWAPVISQLYSTDSATVWTTAESTEVVERDLLAIWWHQWPALRRRFSFCLGATGPRRLDKRAFDLLIVPVSRARTAVADLGQPAKAADGHSPHNRLLLADLQGSAPKEFGKFLRFCAAETHRRSAGMALAQVWTRAASHESLHELANLVAETYPDPTSMRRLKRLLLSPGGALPGMRTEADAVSVIASGRIGVSVFGADANLDSLVAKALEQDRRLVLNATRALLLNVYDADQLHTDHLARTRLRPGAHKTKSGKLAANELPSHVLLQAELAADPNWLVDLVDFLPGLARRRLQAASADFHATAAPNTLPGQRTAWAAHFWTLRPDQRLVLLQAGPSHLARVLHDPIEQESPLEPNQESRRSQSRLAWLAVFSPQPSEGSEWLEEICLESSRLAKIEAVGFFAGELADLPSAERRRWVSAIRAPLSELVLEVVPNLPSKSCAAMLEALSLESSSLRAAALRPWRALSRIEVSGVAAAHLLRLLPTTRPHKDEVLLAGRAYAVCWRSVVDGDESAWHELDNFPRSIGEHDWDRGRRLAFTVAHSIAPWDESGGSTSAAARVLAAAQREDHEAGKQLAEELLRFATTASSSQDNGDKKRKKAKRKGLVEQVAEQAFRVLSGRWR
ncbi:hypothetical protein [Micromonospora sp. NPDC057141]